jgi:hypothetical protein
MTFIAPPSALADTSGHPEWWCVVTMVAVGIIALVERSWWRLDLFLRYQVKTDDDDAIGCHTLLEGVVVAPQINMLRVQT